MGRRDERGAVAAEAAVVLPVMCLFALVMAWLVGLGVTHVRTVDAAREVARAVARGDAVPAGMALGRQVAPPGARISVSHQEGMVLVEVTASVRGPSGLLGFLPERQITADAVAVEERVGEGW